MADSTIKNLTEKLIVGPGDEFPVWDATEATTKKCKVSALDNQLFSKTQKPSASTAVNKDIVIVSYDTNNNATTQRVSFATLQTEVNSSLNGSKLIDGSVTDAKLAVVSSGPNAYSGISPDKLAPIPASKLESTLNLTGKTVTLPTTTTFSNSIVTEDAIATNAVTTAKIKDGSITAAKLASTTVTTAQMQHAGKELAFAWGTVASDLFADARYELAVGASMSLTKTTGYQNRVTVALTGVSHSLKVGDWVALANAARIPATDTSYDAFAWAPLGLANPALAAATQTIHTANLWTNDVIRGADVNANQVSPGQRYIIKTVGDTTWTNAGANYNREGDVFVANSTPLTGTGVAQIVNRYTVGVWPVVSINGTSAFDFETLQTVPAGALNDLIIRPLRILSSHNVLKAGRIFGGRFRIYWKLPAGISSYPVIPTAQNAKDVVMTAGTVFSSSSYVDIICGDGSATSVPDEFRFVAFA